MDFTVHHTDGKTSERRVSITNVCLGRAAGRDLAASRAHMDEVRKSGAIVYSLPNYCRKSRYLFTYENVIEVQERRTGPEVEYVLIAAGKDTLVSVGSDNNDSTLLGLSTKALGTIYDTAKSKQCCPASVARGVWLYDDVKDHWDKLRLKSHTTINGRDVQYQDFALTELRTPETNFKDFPELRNDGTAFLSGSAAGVAGLPPHLYEAASKEGIFPDNFHISIHDPVLGREISHSFKIEYLTWPDSDLSP